MWRRGRAGPSAIACCQDFRYVTLHEFAAPDLDDCADDVSHHVGQKTVRLDIDVDFIAGSVAIGRDDGPRGPPEAGLLARSGETREVMMAEQVTDGRRHLVLVEPTRHVPAILPTQCAAARAICDAISV